MNEEWIDCKTVYLAVKDEYDRLDYSGENWAPSSIIERLKSGVMTAQATNFEIFDDLKLTILKDIEVVMELGKPIRNCNVPRAFWNFIKLGKVGSEEDWIAGDFIISYTNKDSLLNYYGKAQGVKFLNENLPAIGKIVASAPATPSSNRGRPPALWWPKFAEELAIHIHEHGIPEGTGKEGQSALIDAVFSAMNERGETEPTRTLVQPVINAVLERIRSAGK